MRSAAPRSILIRLRPRSEGHVDAFVFTGPGAHRRQLAGTLILSQRDAKALVDGTYEVTVEDQR